MPVIFNAILLYNYPKRTGIHCENQITKPKSQIKYHEQTLSGSVVSNTIETIQMTDETCL